MPEPIEVDQRVEQAVERTLLAWVRTGLAVMGLGFVVARFGLFLREAAAARSGVFVPSSGFSPAVGVSLIAFGAVSMVLAAARFSRTLRRLRAGQPAPLTTGPGLFLSIGLGAVGFALAFYLMVTSR